MYALDPSFLHSLSDLEMRFSHLLSRLSSSIKLTSGLVVSVSLKIAASCCILRGFSFMASISSDPLDLSPC